VIGKNIVEKTAQEQKKASSASPNPINITQDKRVQFFQKQTEADYAKLFGFNGQPQTFNDPILGKRFAWEDSSRNLNINNVEIDYVNESAKPGRVTSVEAAETAAKNFLKERKLDDSGLVLSGNPAY